MPDLRACIFDLDGVLVDTAKYHFLAWQATANKLGIAFTEENNENLKGVSRKESLQYILSLGNVILDEASFQHHLKEKNDYYLELISHMNPDEVLPGVFDFLDEIKSAGLRTALGSASKNAPLILEQCGLKPYLDVVIDGTCFSKSKPDPEVFQKGIDALGVLPASSVVFEDAVSGVMAGKLAGAFVIGVGAPDMLREADYTISGFSGFDLNAMLTVYSRAAINQD